MPAQESSSVVQIGEWVVHPTLNSISRGSETQKLEPRAMRLLICLANSAGEVVSVDRLLTEVWAGVVVGSASVYETVSQLRKILGDLDPKPTYIMTVPRKGYRLIAPVQRGTAAAETPQAPAKIKTVTQRRAWLVAGTLVSIGLAAVYFVAERIGIPKLSAAKHEVTVSVASDKSVAVLPFADMSENKDQEYFADGMAEELINHLSRSPGLKVIARTSSFQFKGRNEDARSIAGRLGVAHLLEGSVRRVGQELRVTTQLIRATDGVQLWSQAYDRNLADIFKIQDEISERVAEALSATLAITSQPIGQRADAEAYNLVLEGNYYKARRTEGDIEKALQLYQKAIDIRPNYALPWARLAGAYLTLEEAKGAPSAKDNTKILAALDRAIRLDPNLVWAYFTRAGFEIAIQWDWAAAQADHDRMRALDPGMYLLPVALGDMALISGHVEEALQDYQRAVELNPLDPNVMGALGVALCASGRYQECLQSRLRLQQLHPELRGVNALIGEARLLLGQLPEALDAMQKEPEQDGRLAGLATVYTAMGKHTESDAALKALEQGFAMDDAYEIARIYAFRRESDAGLEWLQRCFLMHNSKVLFIKTDPLLRDLRQDRRFKPLLAKLHLPE
jgi:TolB-like protein/DNA-binding winged helix-turn-helix (wHTH) protein/cytochrome c-type biogenesis protein CcmH/NrfG